MSESGEDWRGLLDIGLDAMKVGRHEAAERTFDELDDLHATWHFEVPYRNRRQRQITKSRFSHVGVSRHCQDRARHILAAMLHLANGEANSHRGRFIGHRQLGALFGVRTETARTWVRRGLSDLDLVDEHGDLIPIETDFDPAERKRMLERQLRRAGDASRKRAELADWQEQRAAEYAAWKERATSGA